MVKKLCKKLWRDETAEASGIAMILLWSIVALGATVGLITLRDQIVQEFGDLAVALDSLDQSWDLPSTPGVDFQDQPLFQPPVTPTADPDPAGNAPAGLQFVSPGAPESPI